MKTMRRWVVAAMAAACLAACGGGNDAAIPGSGSPAGAPTTKGSFSAVVVFGDSLSDVGAYTPATQVPNTNPPQYFGGKFTTNGTGGIWVENVATTLGLLVTPSDMGFAGQSVACPAAANPALAGTCTGYAQGGSRVTDPIGIGHTDANGNPAALTVPVKTQIENHLARFGSFKDSDLIFVFAGNNDVFVQAGTLSAKAAAIYADTTLTPDQVKSKLFAAQTEAQAAMKAAALELSGYVKDRIIAKGGKYVAVWNLPDSSLTPDGAAQSADARQVLKDLVDVFNLWLREGLTGQPVQVIDAYTAFGDVYRNPAKYNIANVTDRACDGAVMKAKLGIDVAGSSLFCDGRTGSPLNGLAAGADVNTWQFADGVHPTTGGHKLISDFALKSLQAFGWI